MKRRLIGLCAVIALCAAAFSLGTQTDGTGRGGSSSSPRMETLVYVQDHNAASLKDEDAAYMTQINLSFALIVDGRVSIRHLDNLAAAVSYAKKHPDIEFGLAVGGWGADGFSQAAATEEGRAAFTDSAIDIMTTYGFTTLDIDWEYPGSGDAGIACSSRDQENLVLLLTSLRDAMDTQTETDGIPRRLTIAVGGSSWQASQLYLKRLEPLCDQLNLMTYDLAGETAAHHTPLYGNLSGDAAVRAYTTRGVPVNKLMLGCAFYGYGWPCAQGQRGTRKVYSYTQISRLSGYTMGYDDDAQAAFLFADSAFITYDNAQSIRAKAAYCAENGLMGIMCWSYGQDSSGELLRAMNGL